MEKVIKLGLFMFFTVLLSYGTASAQIVDKAKDVAGKTKEVTKDVAGKTKDITVDTAKKAGDAVTDGLDKAGDATVKAAKVGASKTKKFGSNALNVTENVAGDAYEGGKYY